MHGIINKNKLDEEALYMLAMLTSAFVAIRAKENKNH